MFILHLSKKNKLVDIIYIYTKKRRLNRFIYDMQNNCKKSENNYNSWLIVSILVVYLHSKTKGNINTKNKRYEPSKSKHSN